MVATYVFCLVLGSGLALVSIVSDVFDMGGPELDVDVDVDMGLDADVSVDGGAVDAGGWTKWLSIHGLIYFVLGFGLTGSSITWLIGDGLAATLPLALSAGAVSGATVGRFVRYAKSSGSGDVQGDETWSGQTGVVTLPVGFGSIGEVRALRGDRQKVLRALPHGSVERPASDAENSGALIPAPEGWTDVMVVEVVDGIAYVVPVDDDGNPLV